MMLQTQPFEVQDFAGGITDDYIDGSPSQARYIDNFLFTTSKKMVTRLGFDVFDPDYFQVPSGQQRINSIINIDNSYLLIGAVRELFLLEAGVGFTDLLGPSGNNPFSAGDVNSSVAFTTWNDHVLISNDAYSKPSKIYPDSGSTLQLRTAGLPELASDPSVAGTVGTNNYIYTFVYKYEYIADQQTFIDFGPTRAQRVALIQDPGTATVNITSIPVLTNGSDDNYDTANIKVEIYRTITDGTTSYLVGEVSNGTTTFNDNVSDTALQLNVTLYTTGGVLDNDPPPQCKYVHVTNSIGWYGNIKDGTNIYKSRIYQSVQSDPDSVPTGNFIDVDDEIKALNSHEHIPIVFCKKHIYRIDGTYDETGGGFPSKQRINDTVGCVSNNSVVQTPFGTYFAGNDGFYWTDSYKVVKVSEEFNARYRDLEDKDKIYGTFNEEESRVYWSVKQDPASADVDSCFVLDPRFGASKPNATFSTLSGGSNFSPTASVFFQNNWVRGDWRGYIFEHKAEYLTDKVINTLTDPSTWADTTIIYNYESCAFKFGTTSLRKFIPKINIVGQNRTNLSLQMVSINDDGKIVADLAPITFRGNITWGDADVIWGTSDLIWNYSGFIDEFRRFPAKGLRCTYKQVRFTNAFVNIYNSDTFGEAAVNSGAAQAVITGVWPEKSPAYYIYFESDNYSRGFLVESVSSDTLTFEDPAGQAPNGNHKWLIKGYPKGEALDLISYCIHYAVYSDSHLGYRAGNTGANA